MEALSLEIETLLDCKEGRRVAALSTTHLAFWSCEHCGHRHLTVMLHRTDILAPRCVRLDGSGPVPTGRCYQMIRIAHGGWKTVTTKRRINEVLALLGMSLRVVQRDWDWIVGDQSWVSSEPVEAMILGTAYGSPVSAFYPQAYPINNTPRRALELGTI